MKRTAVQRAAFLLLAGALLVSALAWPSAPLDAGTVVTEDLDVVSGRESWLRFYHATQAGRPASVHFTSWFLADEWRPEDVVYEETLVFDGKVYTISGQSGSHRYRCPGDAEYRYLLYFPDVPAPLPSTTYASATHYVLADDDMLTWNDIWKSMISSSTKDRVRYNIVYSEYLWREGIAPQH